VGTDIGIWKSTNAGAVWTHVGPESGIPNVAVFDLQLSPGAGRLIAFTHGRGAFALSSRPTLMAGTRVGNTFTFSFVTLPGGQYVVEYKTNLNAISWQTLTSVQGDGTTKTVQDNTATTAQRFYRVVLN